MAISLNPSDHHAPAGAKVTIKVVSSARLDSAFYPAPDSALDVNADNSCSFTVQEGVNVLALFFKIATAPVNELVTVLELDPDKPASPATIDAYFGFKASLTYQILGIK